MGRCWHTFKMSENDSEGSLRFASHLHKPRLNGKCWTTAAGVFLTSPAFVTSPVRVLAPPPNAGCPPIVSSLYPCDLSYTFIPPFSVFFWGERHFSFASVYFLLSHWLAPTFLLKKRNLLNSQCKPILITLCVLFLGVDSAVRQLDFNLPFLPVNYIKSNPSSPYRTAAIKRAPAPSMSEGVAALTDTTLH